MKSSKFHDLLFEMSHEHRYEILLILQKQAKRITDLNREMELTTTEVRRHVSRLAEVGLVQRDIEGYYRLTPYGEASLILFQEFDFLSSNDEYFQSHTLSKIPTGFVKQIGELSACTSVASVMDFIRFTESLFNESKEYVWLLVDQFPLNSLSTIVEAIERGVQFKIIEPRERAISPDLDSMTSEETRALSRARNTPLVDQRMLNEVNAFVYLSEGRCVLAFPTSDGQYDYRGFTATDDRALKWCRDLFQHYWETAEPRVYVSPTEYVQPKRVSVPEAETRGRIIVEGKEDSSIDHQAIQDAVDNFDEVVLRGTFNIGLSAVVISRSVNIRGEGRENDVPSTTIYKKGWVFPFREWDYVFLVAGEGANVTIENLSFTDFNCTCIGGRQGNSLNIRNNRITIPTGYGRGMTYGAFGDIVQGIWVESTHARARVGGVTIEGNYLDFAPGGFWGYLSRGGLEDTPEYRPDLFNHEYYIGFGIAVNTIPGAVRIENNVVRNANARGIATSGHFASSDVRIRNNTVISDVYGSYPFSSPEAGAGILAQSSLVRPTPGFNIEIEDNTIRLDKLNHSGIVILGPATDREGAEKLKGGIIRNNRIQLKDGYEGIHIRKCDDFEVSGNTISGKAYYGIRASGRRKPGEPDLSALNNLVEDNDMRGLDVKGPDEYSDNHADGRMFAGSSRDSATAYVWLDSDSMRNVVKVRKGETVIDDGEENRISFS